jgi:hypothetical protein
MMKKLILLFALFLVFVPFIVLAETEIGDVVLPGDVPSPWPGPEPTPILIQVIRFFGILIIDFIVNAFVLCIGYLILKQKKLIKSWKFLRYVVFVTIGGALIDLIYVGGMYLSRFKGPLYPNMVLMGIVLLGSVLLTSLGLAFYNYWLSRKVFNLTKKQAIFIGIIMGIFTNPIFAFIITGML